MKANTYLSFLAVVAIALGACGGGDDEGGSGETGNDETSASGGVDPSSTASTSTGSTGMPATSSSSSTTDDASTSTSEGSETGSAGEESGSSGEAACVQMAIGDVVIDEQGSGATFAFVQPDLIGDPKVNDTLYVQFFVEDEGTFDLAEGANDNYATCGQCFVLYEDLTEFDHGAHYFQAEGTITVEEKSDVFGETPTLVASVSGVRLIEVEIGDDFESIPVKGGGCVEIADGSFASTK